MEYNELKAAADKRYNQFIYNLLKDIHARRIIKSTPPKTQ
jgi:hypothetical protein